MEDFICKENGASISCNFSSSMNNIDRTIDAVKNFLRGREIPGRPFDLFFVLRESLNNAVIHGNENNRSLRVACSIHIGHDGLAITVTDEGRGFNWRRQMLEVPVTCNRTSGRGLKAISCFGFSMNFNEEGNTLYLTKKFL